MSEKARHDAIALECLNRAGWLMLLAESCDDDLRPLFRDEYARPDDVQRAKKRGTRMADMSSRIRGYKDHYEERTAMFSRAKWHERRGRGVMNVVEKVEACQTEEYVRACVQCGTVDQPDDDKLVTRCERWRYCVSCRGARCAEYRARFDAAAEQWRKCFRAEMGSQWRRWSEKMATFTVPHSGYTIAGADPAGRREYEPGSAPRDLAVLYVCFRRFFPIVRQWLAKSDSRVKHFGLPLPYLRVFELTGSGDGHAHLHTWLLGPYLPHWVARIEWGKSIGYSGARKGDEGKVASYLPVRHIDDVIADCLVPGPTCSMCSHASCKHIRWTNRTASKQIRELATVQHGRRIQWLPWPVVDIRAASGPVGNELVKYMTKDIGPDGDHVDAFDYAQLVVATEGRRLVCSSLHFWLLLPKRVCSCCEMSFVRTRIEAGGARSAGGARAPPLH